MICLYSNQISVCLIREMCVSVCAVYILSDKRPKSVPLIARLTYIQIANKAIR